MSAEKRAVSKASKLPQVTIGFAIIIATSIWWASGRWRDAEVGLTDVTTRQAKYIERRNEQHAEMEAQVQRLHDDIEALEKALSARFGEVVP